MVYNADMNTMEQFLIDHNKLSPLNLQATIGLLLRFKTRKPALFKSDEWPVDKIRRPFIFWLSSLSRAEKEEISDKNTEA